MALSDFERSRVRYHLGYIDVAPAASIQLGIPKPIQTLFLVEEAMNNVLPGGEDRVRRILGVMDGVEDKLIESQERLAAIELGSLKLREDEPDKLEREYVRWGMRLADILGVPIYPYSTKYRMGSGVAAGSIPVRG